MRGGIGTIVVGVASVGEPDPVLPSAIRLAESVGARLHIVHVLALPDTAVDLDGGWMQRLHPGTDYLAEESAAAEAALRAQHARLAGAGQEVRVEVVSGSPHRQIAAIASRVGADLLVIGATRRGRIWRNLLGTTAERVLREARVPVLVMHQPFFRPVERILLTTDLSGLSADIHETALDAAEGLFGAQRTECRSLLVVGHHLAPPPPLRAEAIETIAALELEEFLESRRPRAYPVEGRVRVGEPPTEINVEADSWEADLIVLGTHGRSGLSRYVVGSVAASTLRDASRNALVIPASARRTRPKAAPPPRSEIPTGA